MSPDDESAAVAQINERLVARHPEVPRVMVDTVVSEVSRDFAGSRVRAFIPLLVERYAGAMLDDAGLDHPSAVND